MEKGLIQIYYGDGKGKTTAALGQALRCAGRGFKVLYVPFLKNRDSGEFMLDLPFDVMVPEYNYGFWNSLKDCEKKHSRECAMEILEKVIVNAHQYDMIVLDELLDAVILGCTDSDEVLKFINNKPETTELVITGHVYYKEIFQKADCITEMKKIKHHFDKGIGCRTGIEK